MRARTSIGPETGSSTVTASEGPNWWRRVVLAVVGGVAIVLVYAYIYRWAIGAFVGG